MKEHIKKDSNRYFVVQILKMLDLAKFILYTFKGVEFSISIDKTRLNKSKIHDCERNSSPMISTGNGILVKLGNNFTCVLSKS